MPRLSSSAITTLASISDRVVKTTIGSIRRVRER
jgi:hypothetical protein